MLATMKCLQNPLRLDKSISPAEADLEHLGMNGISREWAPQSYKSCAAPPLPVISRTVGPASELWSGRAEIGPTGPIIIQQLTYQPPREHSA